MARSFSVCRGHSLSIGLSSLHCLLLRQRCLLLFAFSSESARRIMMFCTVGSGLSDPSVSIYHAVVHEKHWISHRTVYRYVQNLSITFICEQMRYQVLTVRICNGFKIVRCSFHWFLTLAAVAVGYILQNIYFMVLFNLILHCFIGADKQLCDADTRDFIDEIRWYFNHFFFSHKFYSIIFSVNLNFHAGWRERKTYL